MAAPCQGIAPLPSRRGSPFPPRQQRLGDFSEQACARSQTRSRPRLESMVEDGRRILAGELGPGLRRSPTDEGTDLK